ncbi:hypothetical protein BCV70DRAFT_202466 [Testicularia cyperi]|uniref:HRDC domain-containing protein n=1 Tax=Testicularia cyperi TaxID=1882483 RepID=A0A317XJD2_9BASI|nr:hypothetical protein BCV70DRAFT_202466 [Testicularia cyperi]
MTSKKAARSGSAADQPQPSPSPSTDSSSAASASSSTAATAATAATVAASLTSASSSSSSSSTSDAIPNPKTDLSAYLLRLQSALQPLTRNASQIPSHGDLAFHRSMDRKLGKKLDAESDRILDTISDLAMWVAADSRAPKIPLMAERKDSKGKLKLELADVTTKESFNTNIGELVDHLLENADTCLDEYSGKLAPRNLASNGTDGGAAGTSIAGAGTMDGKSLPKTGPLPQRILNAPIPPPQRNFSTKPDNSSNTTWSRTLKFGKPNASVPLGHANEPRLGPDGQPLPRGPRRGMYCAEGDPLDNPYYHEIVHSDAPAHALSKPEQHWKDNPPPPLNEKEPSLSTDASPFEWITTKTQIEALRDHLLEDRVTEIAIDLEHHSYRTYQGIVCLMQLSTRWGDWILDTLSDEVREYAELLNTSFTDPNKVKVLHGANHDVLWLQRDLGLYLVNLFDTYHATNVLMFPSHGLNYLMARYCNFDADKRYQLADWRIRPLPKEMLYYARSDTHTLLYIYDNLRHELMESGGVNAIKEVFVRSKEVAMAVYAKEEWDVEGETREGWRSVWRKWGGEAALGTEDRVELKDMKKEERLVRALHRWRDGVAREEDESPRYILGATNLMMLASRAPTKPEGVLACIPPNAAALKKRTKELAQLIAAEVEAWEKDEKERRAKAIESLESGAQAADGDIDMDIGEAVARPTATSSKAARAPVDLDSVAISATSQVSTLQPVDLSVWHSSSTSNADPAAAVATPESVPAKSRFGAVRSLASGLFGRNKATSVGASAAPASASTPSGLASSSSKLFGSSPLLHAGNVTERTDRKIDSIKAGFVDEIGSIFGVRRIHSEAGPSIQQDALLDERTALEPETVAFVPSAERTTLASSDVARAKGADDESAGESDDSDKREDYIVVSASRKSSKARSQDQDAETSKGKGKKRKAPADQTTDPSASASASAPAAKARKQKYDGEFDFTSAEAKAQFENKDRDAKPGKNKSKKPTAANPAKSKSKSDPTHDVFRRQKDRARRKVGPSGMF